MPGIEKGTTGKVTISVNLNKQEKVRVATISETVSNTSRANANNEEEGKRTSFGSTEAK